MNHLRLHPHVSYGMVDGRPIFLDVRRDRYLALDAGGQAAFEQARQEYHAAGCQETDTARLLATKLFTLADEWQPMAPVEVGIPVRQLSGAEPSGRLPLRDVPEIGMLVWRARRRLRSKALEQILSELKGRRKKVAKPASAADTAALAWRFRIARALVPIAPSCLQDSIALGIWLARRSACPTIVFGVKLDPFAAHCWVQTDEAILNDAPDTVAPFAPVLVLS
jgi:hypothetical protein